MSASQVVSEILPIIVLTFLLVSQHNNSSRIKSKIFIVALDGYPMVCIAVSLGFAFIIEKK